MPPPPNQASTSGTISHIPMMNAQPNVAPCRTRKWDTMSK